MTGGRVVVLATSGDALADPLGGVDVASMSYPQLEAVTTITALITETSSSRCLGCNRPATRWRPRTVKA